MLVLKDQVGLKFKKMFCNVQQVSCNVEHIHREIMMLFTKAFFAALITYEKYKIQKISYSLVHDDTPFAVSMSSVKQLSIFS